jgi:hypothetical protein
VLQMKTTAPLQLMNLGKSFVIFFIVTSLAWIAANFVIFRKFYIGLPILIGNVVISGLVGWWWYRRQHHARFSWDERVFELQRGTDKSGSRGWQDFSRVSLVHEGYGRFAVRLYEDSGEYVDIPASDLKLEPSDLRFEVMDLIKGTTPDGGARGPGKE